MQVEYKTITVRRPLTRMERRRREIALRNQKIRRVVKQILFVIPAVILFFVMSANIQPIRTDGTVAVPSAASRSRQTVEQRLVYRPQATQRSAAESTRPRPAQPSADPALEKPETKTDVQTPVREEVKAKPEQPMKKPTISDYFTDSQILKIAKTVTGEALVTRSDTEMSAVIWCILNRLDVHHGGAMTVDDIIIPSQFNGYHEETEVPEHIMDLTYDVLGRWLAEKTGEATPETSGRTLPTDYLYFTGDGLHNHFIQTWPTGVDWDWSLTSPYEN